MKTIKPEKLYINDDYQIKYHIDEFGVYWYNYKDLIKVLLITSRKSDQIYRDWLNENDKTWFNELNILNNETGGEKYITTEAVCKLINRNNARANGILITILNNETKHEEEFSDFKNELCSLKMSINNDNYVNVATTIKDITQSNAYRDLMNKYDPNYDKEKEEMIDFIRDDIYEYWDCFDEVLIPLTKRPDYEEKQTTIKHKKNSKPTHPEWLGKVVK